MLLHYRVGIICLAVAIGLLSLTPNDLSDVTKEENHAEFFREAHRRKIEFGEKYLEICSPMKDLEQEEILVYIANNDFKKDIDQLSDLSQGIKMLYIENGDKRPLTDIFGPYKTLERLYEFSDQYLNGDDGVKAELLDIKNYNMGFQVKANCKKMKDYIGYFEEAIAFMKESLADPNAPYDQLTIIDYNN